MGYKVAYSPLAVITHYGGGSTQTIDVAEYQDIKFNSVIRGNFASPMRVYYINRNSIIIILKNFEFNQIFPSLILRFIYNCLQTILLLRIKPTMILLLVRARLWPIVYFKSIWQKRLFIQSNRKVADKWLINKDLVLSLGKTVRQLTNRH